MEKMWKTKQELEAAALKFNPKVQENIDNDPDYCIRGTVSNSDGKYADAGLYELYIKTKNFILDKILNDDVTSDDDLVIFIKEEIALPEVRAREVVALRNEALKTHLNDLDKFEDKADAILEKEFR